MNAVEKAKYRAEAARLTRVSAPVVSIYDAQYMQRARAEGNRQRAHEARVQNAYKRAAELQAATERDWKRTKTTFAALAVLTVATALANMFGMWGGFFG